MLSTTKWCVMAHQSQVAIDKFILDIALEVVPDMDDKTLISIAVTQTVMQDVATINASRAIAAEYNDMCVFGKSTKFKYAALEGAWEVIKL